jgi:hypothetical protein
MNFKGEVNKMFILIAQLMNIHIDHVKYVWDISLSLLKEIDCTSSLQMQ